MFYRVESFQERQGRVATRAAKAFDLCLMAHGFIFSDPDALLQRQGTTPLLPAWALGLNALGLIIDKAGMKYG